MSLTQGSTTFSSSGKPVKPSECQDGYHYESAKAHEFISIPDWLLRKMLLNNAVSAAVGFVPMIGDVVLAAFKANSRNAALLEEYLRIRGEEFLKKESERVEDPGNVRPGAGRAPGEHVPGKDDKSARLSPKSSSGGWFGRKSKGKAAATVNTSSDGLVPHRDSRFVENVSSQPAAKS